MADLTGRTVYFLTANEGVEHPELAEPWALVSGAGATVVHVAPQAGPVRAVTSDLDPAEPFEADRAVTDVAIGDADLLVIPGGTVNADRLRLDEAAVDLVREAAQAGIGVAAICHGPWVLVEADLVRGRTVTSWPSLRTDIGNAGGTWVDEEVVVSDDLGWRLITSRNPGDLEAFGDAIVRTLQG